MKIIEVPIVISNTEGQGTRRGSVAARGVGGATDRDSLSTREANENPGSQCLKPPVD
jgi:hypothetical protein